MYSLKEGSQHPLGTSRECRVWASVCTDPRNYGDYDLFLRGYTRTKQMSSGFFSGHQCPLRALIMQETYKRNL